MNKLFINMILALTPVMSTMASDMLEEIERTESVTQHMVYMGNGIGFSSNFSPSLLKHVSPLSLHLGHRIQRGHNGFDYRIQLWVPFSEQAYVQGVMAYQYYFSPELPSQTYVGLGIATGRTAETFLSVIPHIRIGKEFYNQMLNDKKGFVELQFRQNEITQEEMDNMVNSRIERNKIENNKQRSMIPLYIIKYMPDITISTGFAF